MSSTCKQSRHLRFWQLCAHCLWPARHYTTNKCSEKKTHREIIRTLLPKFCWHCIKNSLSLKNGTMWQRIHISITTYISTYITVWHKQFLAWKKILEITLCWWKKNHPTEKKCKQIKIHDRTYTWFTFHRTIS